MFKRITWFGVGAVTGAATTIAAGRKLKAKVEEVVPSSVTDGVARTGRAVRGRWSAAVTDGRQASARREAQLRDRFERRPRPRPLD
jgi:hypothetical protein